MPMAKVKDEKLLVWLDDPAYGPLQQIGTLSKGERGTVRFAYQQEWLRHTHAFPLDPELDLTPGEFYPVRSNFGVFMDSCPDRWGQTLMKRREVIEAKSAGRTPRTLHAWDFLIGVQDITRMGALRFNFPGEEQFLASEELAAPPVTMIAELQEVALGLTRKDEEDYDKIRQWLRVLVAPGASLGGARPKANITDVDGTLWIAKFPAADDDYDVALWEKLLHDLAARCGIRVPSSRLLQIGNGYHTFMVKRFDRVDGRRRFFTSAMTMLHKQDTDPASYLELPEFLTRWGSPKCIDQDLREMFTRVVFNVATANRDDHLRNHGFIRLPDGWVLSPAYDMNPSFKKDEHVLSLDLYTNQPDLDAVLATAEYYRLREAAAAEIINNVLKEVRLWQDYAKKLGISRREMVDAEHLFMS